MFRSRKLLVGVAAAAAILATSSAHAFWGGGPFNWGGWGNNWGGPWGGGYPGYGGWGGGYPYGGGYGGYPSYGSGYGAYPYADSDYGYAPYSGGYGTSTPSKPAAKKPEKAPGQQ